MRSIDTRPSTRASGAPGQEWMPRLNAMCSRTFLRSRENSCGFSNRSGSRLAAPGLTITVVPAGTVVSPSVVVLRAIRNTLFTGLSIRRHSSTKIGMRLRSSRSCCWMSGRSPSTRIAAPSSFAVVSWPAANRNVAVRTTSTTSGVEPSGYFAVAIEVSTSSRG